MTTLSLRDVNHVHKIIKRQKCYIVTSTYKSIYKMRHLKKKCKNPRPLKNFMFLIILKYKFKRNLKNNGKFGLPTE